jgi:hypothetical protein
MRPSQLLAVSSLSSGGMNVALIKANRMMPATSTMVPNLFYKEIVFE